MRIEYIDSATGDWVFGWLRRGDAASVVLGSQERCSAEDAAHVLSAFPTEARRCYGGKDLELSPVYVQLQRAGLPSLYGGTPRWQAEPSRYLAQFSRDGDSGAMPVHFSPESGLSGLPDGWYSMSGRFADPRSQSCSRWPTGPPFVAESPAEQILWCNQQFVVTNAVPAAAPTL